MFLDGGYVHGVWDVDVGGCLGGWKNGKPKKRSEREVLAVHT